MRPRSRRTWTSAGALFGDDPAADIAALARSDAIYARVRALRPAHFAYAGLLDALARLRRIAAAGGWPRVGTGPALRAEGGVTLRAEGGVAVRADSATAAAEGRREGAAPQSSSSGERVLALRRRLAINGDLSAAADTAGARFDAALDDAVRAFQRRHALNDDGVVGPATLAQLDLPVAARVAQVRANLERARWLPREREPALVVVNVAGATVYFVRDGAIRLETRAVVGKPSTATPLFRADLRSVELNPTWTVPPGIVGEVLRAVRRDAGYLRKQGMRVIDRSGRRVDPSRIDFSRYSARSFPYVFRQDPGPLNPLGRIKLVFPNRYNVYLHDTSAPALFELEERACSHGCIRVQDPVDLAELVLDDARWSRDSLDAAIATGATRMIAVRRPLPVVVLYWTAAVDRAGTLHFYRDVYRRDPPLLKALDTPLAR